MKFVENAYTFAVIGLLYPVRSIAVLNSQFDLIGIVNRRNYRLVMSAKILRRLKAGKSDLIIKNPTNLSTLLLLIKNSVLGDSYFHFFRRTVLFATFPLKLQPYTVGLLIEQFCVNIAV